VIGDFGRVPEATGPNHRLAGAIQIGPNPASKLGRRLTKIQHFLDGNIGEQIGYFLWALDLLETLDHFHHGDNDRGEDTVQEMVRLPHGRPYLGRAKAYGARCGGQAGEQTRKRFVKSGRLARLATFPVRAIRQKVADRAAIYH
jgi:hypothetical protein